MNDFEAIDKFAAAAFNELGMRKLTPRDLRRVKRELKQTHNMTSAAMIEV